MKPEPMLYLSDSRGIYIPRDFATETRRDCISGVNDETLAILATGPDHEFYWDAWDEVQNNARVTDPEACVTYYVFQNGDCWLVPDGMQVDESRGFFWPDDSEED